MHLLRDNSIACTINWQFLVNFLQVLHPIMLLWHSMGELLVIGDQISHVVHVFATSSVQRSIIFAVKNTWTNALAESPRGTVFLILLRGLDLLTADSSYFANIRQFAHVCGLHLSSFRGLDHDLVVVVFELFKPVWGGCCWPTRVHVINHLFECISVYLWVTL